MTGFTWPPTPTPASHTTQPIPSDPGQLPPMPVRTPSPRTWLGHLERTLLGLGEAPFDELARANDWSPISPDRCCPACARQVGPGQVSEGRCSACREESIPWARAITLGPFVGVLRGGLLAAKYGGSRASAAQIGRHLGLAICVAIEAEGIAPESALLVPIPTTFRRRMARGIDHVGLITNSASRTSGVAIGHLLRREHRPSQVSLPATKRWANVRGCMRAARTPGPDTRALIVIDDLRTTGATLREACRVLRENKTTGESGGSERSIWCAFAASASETSAG